MTAPDPLNTLVRDVTDVTDAVSRARLAGERMDQLGRLVDQLSSLRQDAILEMVTGGMSQAQAARALGLTRARVSQILSSGAPQERAFLGTRSLTVAIGGKLEGGRRDGIDQPVVSAEAMAAYEVLADTARAVGLDATCEIVPPPGLVDLARPDLVVLTAPRLLPMVGQVLGADPSYGFAQDDQGWYLIDKVDGGVHRPPRDTTGEPADYAYLGRLPRPDGKGTFLYLAGVHAMGTLGAATFLADNLQMLWREHRQRRFSMLLTCTYDRMTRRIQSVDPLAPARRHEVQP